MNRRAAAYLLAFLLATCVGALFSTPASSIASTKSVAAGKLFQAQADEGWFTTSTAFTFSLTAKTGSVRYFQNFRMTPGDTFPLVGFGSRGGNMTVSAVDDKSVSMNMVVPV